LADAMTTRRHMLPSALLEEPGSKRTGRDWLVDVAALLIAIGIGVLVFGPSEDQHSELGALIDLVSGVIGWIALWWRRRWPVAVAVLTLSLSAISAFVAGAALIALFNVALRGSRRALVLTTALGLTTATIYSLIYPDDELPFVMEVLLSVLITLFVIPWGLFTRAQRDLLRSANERARAAEAEQRAHIEQAREAERRRIAGEMHDVLAHRLSLLSLHAGALEFRPDAPPEEIAEAAGVIRANARDALGELREVIGVLRAEAAGDAPPQPTLDAIPSLIEESRAAGMKVRAHVDAAGGDILLGRTAYRVVQEGLTNARKHAPAAAVEVTVAAADELGVEVVSRRAAQRVEPDGAGSGLIGLAERVALAGGALEHGPNPRGDFVLRAILPWTP
jgi:signal transduction histidine kinase